MFTVWDGLGGAGARKHRKLRRRGIVWAGLEHENTVNYVGAVWDGLGGAGARKHRKLRRRGIVWAGLEHENTVNYVGVVSFGRGWSTKTP